MKKTPPKELTSRIQTAKNDRARMQALVNGYLALVDPVRPRIGDNVAKPVNRENEVDDLFSTEMADTAFDFGSDVIARIMPRDRDWLTYEVLEQLPDEIKVQIEPVIKARTRQIFDAIRASNLYDEGLSEWALDLGHGTGGLMITDPGYGQPAYCEAIAPHQALLIRGARGLSFKGRECAWTLAEALAYWPTYDWPEEFKRRAKDDKDGCKRVIVGEYATRIPDPGDERWLWQVVVDGHLAHTQELKGKGSCPIIFTRWRTISSTAWGLGPMLPAVPNGRVLDQVSYLMLKSLGKNVDPPFFYDDDGTLNFEGGLAPGAAIPREKGSRIDFWEPSARLDAGFFQEARLEDKVRRAGFQAGPRQRGLTPPTAFQWADEKAEEGRRLEMPTGKLYAEAVLAIVERFEFMMMASGAIDELIPVKDYDKAIRARPQNPLARQQDYESVQSSFQILNAARAAFDGQLVAGFVDARATFENIKSKLNDENIVMREEEQADELLRGVLGQPGMAPGLETAPGTPPVSAA